MITKQENILIADAGISLQQWLYDRVEKFISGRVLEIAEGSGIIAPICEDHVEVEQIDLGDEDFEERYAEMIGAYDTLIVLHAGEQFKNDRNIAFNAALLLKQGGHIITRLPARTALYNGLNQGFRHWKRNNLEFISHVLRKDFSIMKTRYFIIADELQTAEWITKYSERVTLFNTENVTGLNAKGLSMIVVGRKRQHSISKSKR